MDDRPLVRAAIRGDRDALGALLMLHRKVLIGDIHHFLVRFNLERYADDILQDVYVNAIVGFRRYDPTAGQGFLGWLLKVKDNQLLKFVQRNPEMLAEYPLPDGEIDDAGDVVEWTPIDGDTHAMWTCDQHATPVAPAREPTRRKLQRKYTPPRPNGGSRLKPVPRHVLQNRQAFAAMM